MAVLDDLLGKKPKVAAQSKPAPPQPLQGVENFQPPPPEAWGMGNPNTMGDWMASNPTGTIKKTEMQPMAAPAPQPVALKNTETAAEAAARAQQPVAQPAPEPFKPQSYVDIVNHVGRPQQLSPEELEREQKREQTRARILAVADAISAIGEMSAVSQGAAPAKILNLSSTAMRRYQERLSARKADQDAYQSRLEKAAMSDFARQQKIDLDREQRAYEVERDELAWKRKAEEAANNRDWEAEQNANRQAEAARLQKERLDHDAKESKAARGVRYAEINARASKTASTDERIGKVQRLDDEIAAAQDMLEDVKKSDPRNFTRIDALNSQISKATVSRNALQRGIDRDAKESQSGSGSQQTSAQSDEEDNFLLSYQPIKPYLPYPTNIDPEGAQRRQEEQQKRDKTWRTMRLTGA